MSLSGEWQGKLFDATGVSAQAGLLLREEGGELSGEFTIYLHPHDDDPCAEPADPITQAGAVSGKFDEKGGTVEIVSSVDLGGETLDVTLQGRVVDADPHALRAIYGCYAIPDSKGPHLFEGGGCVLWEYAGSSGREGDRG